MPPKKKEEEKPRVLLGRPGNNVKAGLVGLPNVGKSTTFNMMCKMSVPAENFPFCTIDPTESRVQVPDPQFTELIGACCKTGALDASFGLLYQMVAEGRGAVARDLRHHAARVVRGGRVLVPQSEQRAAERLQGAPGPRAGAGVLSGG